MLQRMRGVRVVASLAGTAVSERSMYAWPSNREWSEPGQGRQKMARGASLRENSRRQTAPERGGSNASNETRVSFPHFETVVKIGGETRLKKLAVLLLAVAAAVIGWGILRKSRPPAVGFTRVQRQTLVSTLPTNGKVEPYEWRPVRAETAGLLATLAVHEGEQVAAGEELAEISDPTRATDLEAAQARVDEARAHLASLEQGGRPAELTEIDNNLARARFELEKEQKDYAALKRLQEKQAATAQRCAEGSRQGAAIANRNRGPGEAAQGAGRRDRRGCGACAAGRHASGAERGSRARGGGRAARAAGRPGVWAGVAAGRLSGRRRFAGQRGTLRPRARPGVCRRAVAGPRGARSSRSPSPGKRYPEDSGAARSRKCRPQFSRSARARSAKWFR